MKPFVPLLARPGLTGMLLGILLAGFTAPAARAQDAAALDAGSLDVPDVVLLGVPFSVSGQAPVVSDSVTAAFSVQAGGQTYPIAALDEGGRFTIDGVTVEAGGPVEVVLQRDGQAVGSATSRAITGWWSLLPPLLAIVMALVFRQVVPALFFGIWIGAWAAVELSLGGLWRGLLHTLEVYILDALADADHASIILFSLMIGGLVGIISKNGGMQGIVNGIIGWARSAGRGQLATGVLGLAVFFDDYANTLIVGNTMRAVTDRLRISREKLAYIVDSTAAPVACLALVTTWIGYEVGLVGTAVANIEDLDVSPYIVFLNSIPYSFYPLLAILFVFGVALMRRDFGPMYAAEVRARTTGQVFAPDARIDEAAAEGGELKPSEDKPHRAVNAVVPVLVLVFGVLAGLYVTGEGETLQEIIGSANSYTALLWASLLSVLTAGLLSVSQRILTLTETVESWYTGLRSMMLAMIILVLAWALSAVTDVLHTADYLVSVLGQTIPVGVLPALIFILSALTAFSTGSSWGTMGILMPLVIPLTWAVLLASGIPDADHHILYSTVSAVLAGSVWGDHCSPISDTTILSSMASGCDHIEHVRTQLPYALTVGIVAVVLGTLPAGLGVPWWVCLPVGAVVVLGILRYFGKPVEEVPVEEDASPVTT